MIKKPQTYLFYAIIAFAVTLYGARCIFILHTRDEWYILLAPFIVGIVLLARYFIEKKKA